eukprot:gene6991-11157_t
MKTLSSLILIFLLLVQIGSSQFIKTIKPFAFFEHQITVKVGQESKIFSFNLKSDENVDVYFMTNQQFVDFELLYAAGKTFDYVSAFTSLNVKSYNLNPIAVTSTSYVVVLNKGSKPAVINYYMTLSTFITKNAWISFWDSFFAELHWELPLLFGLFFTGATVFNLMRFIKLKLRRYDEKAEYEKQKNELKIDRMFEDQVLDKINVENPGEENEDDEEDEENNHQHESDAYFPRESFENNLAEPDTPDVYYK